jgi:hypothetical protein
MNIAVSGITRRSETEITIDAAPPSQRSASPGGTQPEFSITPTRTWIIYRPANNSDSLFLEIPTPVPESLCVHPRKYLRYLGWCIQGVEGCVVMDSPRSEDDIGDKGPLEDQGIYRYRFTTFEDPEGLSFFLRHSSLTFNEGNPLQHAIDPEVIKMRSTMDIRTLFTIRYPYYPRTAPHRASRA